MEFDPETIERYRLKLRYKVCYHLGSFCPDVEDVVQESLTRFLVALRDKKVQHLDSLGAFLSGICNNVILEYRRKLWREPLVQSDSLPTGPAVAPAAHAIENRDAIRAALSQLSERDCGLLRAFYLQEKDKPEICRAVGMNDAQFRVALFRAKDRFRKIYNQNLKHAASGVH